MNAVARNPRTPTEVMALLSSAEQQVGARIVCALSVKEQRSIRIIGESRILKRIGENGPPIVLEVARLSIVSRGCYPVNEVRPFPLTLLDRLTPAQRRVALLLIEGYSNKEISATLGRAEPTIKHQICDILSACAVPSRSRFIAAYYQEVLGSVREGRTDRGVGERREFGT